MFRVYDQANFWMCIHFGLRKSTKARGWVFCSFASADIRVGGDPVFLNRNRAGVLVCACGLGCGIAFSLRARRPPVITGSFLRRSFLGGSSGSKIHQVQEPENQNLFEKCSKTCFGDLPEGNKSGNFAMSVPEEPRAEGREKCEGSGVGA